MRPKELVFLVDKSGSMMGAPFDRVRALVTRALDAMGPDDTFQVVAFDGAAQAMSEAPLPATPSAIARAKAWLARLEGGGGTEMLEGVRTALSRPRTRAGFAWWCSAPTASSGTRPEIIEAVEALRGRARVFGFGIGTSVNRYLVEGVGRAGRGASKVVSLDEPPDAAVERLFGRIDRPVLTDLELAFEGAEVTDLLPARLPDLFAGQPLVVAARVRGGRPSHVVLRGRLGEAPWVARLAVAEGRAGAGDGTEQPVVGTLWARRRIDELWAHAPPRRRLRPSRRPWRSRSASSSSRRTPRSSPSSARSASTHPCRSRRRSCRTSSPRACRARASSAPPPRWTSRPGA